MLSDLLTIRELRQEHAELVSSTFRGARRPRPILPDRSWWQLAVDRWRRRARPVWHLLFLTVREPGLVIGQFLLSTGTYGASPNQLSRLFELRRLIRGQAPTDVIEFGTGASTLLLHKYTPGTLASFEEDADWRDFVLGVARRIWPRRGPLLANRLHHAPRLEREIDGVHACHYDLPAWVRQRRFDLAYIDGPTALPMESPPAGSRPIDPKGLLPNADVMLLQRPRIIAVDTRRATMRLIVESGRFDDYFVMLRSQFAAARSSAEPSPTFGGWHHSILFAPADAG